MSATDLLEVIDSSPKWSRQILRDYVYHRAMTGRHEKGLQPREYYRRGIFLTYAQDLILMEGSPVVTKFTTYAKWLTKDT
jgi:hypothetical protein